MICDTVVLYVRKEDTEIFCRFMNVVEAGIASSLSIRGGKGVFLMSFVSLAMVFVDAL